MIGGLYQITNIQNGHFYIGSTVNIDKRWGAHRLNLRKNKHSNKHLQHAWNKYGEDVFRFHIIQRCPPDDLRLEEQKLLDRYVGKPHCYNLNENANGYAPGRKESSAQLEKRIISLTGRTLSSENKRKIGDANRGHCMSQTQRIQLSNYNRGKQLSIETKRKIGQALQGERGPNAKLNTAQVIEIRQTYIPRVVSGNSLAKRYGVSKKQIFNIIHRKTWKHL